MKKRTCRRINDTELKRLWPTRISDKELAARMGHHRGSLRRRAEKLGLPKSRRLIWNDDAAPAQRLPQENASE